MTNFEGVIQTLSQALNKRGYLTLTPVQQAVLAPEVSSADLLVSAQTGSGKTVAFGISIAPTLLEGHERFGSDGFPQAIVIAPTRELALQVQRELDWLFEAAGAIVVSCVGGMDMRTERRALGRGAHIVVGTPGRLRDHVERGSLDLSRIKAVVLDEADEMLDMGFRDELEFILSATPKGRRTLMFSATVPKPIITLAKRYQRDAVRLSTVSEQEQHRDIEYCAFNVSAKDRENAIINVLRFYDAKTAIVFCATRATVNRMTSRFNNRGFSVVALSGELSQGQRTHALQSIRDGRVRVCIATDVAARGIDLPNLDLVVHADLPRNSDSLLHRSGRTGRAGRKGTTALIVPHNAQKRTERLFKNAKINATWSNPPTVHEISLRDDERILQDPVLTAPLEDQEQEFVKRLLATQSAEQIAGAFIRLYRSGQSAPEEISDTIFEEGRSRKNDPARGRSSRKSSRDGRDSSKDAFEKGIWFSLSVGRKHTAEARWLLPAIIRAGNLDKRDVGAIKIEESQTYFEIAPKSAEKFMEALGPSRKLEKSMSVNRIGEYPKALKERNDPVASNDQRRKPNKTNFSVKKNDDRRKPNEGIDKENNKFGRIKEKLNYKRDARQNSKSQEKLGGFLEATTEEKTAKSQQDIKNYLTERDERKDVNQKLRKSKKVKKNKGKRSKNLIVSIDEQKSPEFKRGPKLKLAKVGDQKRARVNRKTGGHSEPGSSPLKRKN
jgi:ATP-dependent RNA helicase DeaD